MSGAEAVGVSRSGTHSPTLRCNVGLAYVPTEWHLQALRSPSSFENALTELRW